MIVAGTGHRPSKLGGYDVATSKRLVDLAGNFLRREKPDKVISGMALGWDQALAWAAFDLDIPFIAAISFDGQESRWSSVDQQWFVDLLELAEEVVHTSEPGYAVWKMQHRNKWMVDNADHVVALWDGSTGGTANCIKYAERVGKPITNLWSEYNGY